MADARDTTSRSNQWQDWLNLLLAVWLFVSPWVLGFTTADGGTSVAAWNTCIVARVARGERGTGYAAASAGVGCGFHLFILLRCHVR